MGCGFSSDAHIWIRQPRWTIVRFNSAAKQLCGLSSDHVGQSILDLTDRCICLCLYLQRTTSAEEDEIGVKINDIAATCRVTRRVTRREIDVTHDEIKLGLRTDTTISAIQTPVQKLHDIKTPLQTSALMIQDILDSLTRVERRATLDSGDMEDLFDAVDASQLSILKSLQDTLQDTLVLDLNHHIYELELLQATINDICRILQTASSPAQLHVTSHLSELLDSLFLSKLSRLSPNLRVILMTHRDTPAMVFPSGDRGALELVLSHMFDRSVGSANSGQVIIRTWLENERLHVTFQHMPVPEVSVGSAFQVQKELYGSGSSEGRSHGDTCETKEQQTLFNALVAEQGWRHTKGQRGRASELVTAYIAQHQSPRPRLASALNRTRRSRLELLLVDDVSQSLAIVTRLIRHHFTEDTVRLHTCTSGEDAIELLRSFNGAKIAAVITDQQMFGVSGIDLGVWIQEHSRAPLIEQVVLLSGCDWEELQIPDGVFAAVWSKPLNTDHLIDFVANAQVATANRA